MKITDERLADRALWEISTYAEKPHAISFPDSELVIAIARELLNARKVVQAGMPLLKDNTLDAAISHFPDFDGRKGHWQHYAYRLKDALATYHAQEEQG